MKPKNPFVLLGYEGPEYFCDREKETEWLKDQWQNNRNVVVHSWRRMGKTALIKHFFHLAEKEHKAEHLYVDLLGTAGKQEAIERIGRAVLDRYGSVKKGISGALQKLLGHIGASISFDPHSGNPKITFDLVTPPDPELSLHAIGEFLSNRKRPVLIALDEFQKVVKYEDSTAEALFRSWAQEFPDLWLIFSGSHRNMMVSMFNESKRPFYRSAQMMALDPIPKEKYKSFIRKKFEKGGSEIPDNVIERIFSWSRKQTYYIQLLCNKLYATGGKPSINKVDTICNELLDQDAHVFANYRNLLTEKQWEILTAIAIDDPVKGPYSEGFRRKHNLGAASTVETALKTLIEKELIIRQNNQYMIHDTMLCRWLQKWFG